jgi:hypothetical protein
MRLIKDMRFYKRITTPTNVWARDARRASSSTVCAFSAIAATTICDRDQDERWRFI